MDQFAVIQRLGSVSSRSAHREFPLEGRNFTKATLFAAMRLAGLVEIVLSFRMVPAVDEPGRTECLLERIGLTAFGDQRAIHLEELPNAAIVLARDLLADCAHGMAPHCDASGALHFDAEAGTILIDYNELPDRAALCSIGV